jgi:hypothetical protein
VAFVACAAIAHAGCGDSHPPLLGSDFGSGPGAGGTSSGPDSGSNGSNSFDYDSGAIFCPKLPDGGVCGCLDLPLIGEAPNLYFVLDRSGSMDTDNKWTTVRNVVTDVMRKLGPRGKFGAAVFPDPRTDQCGTGIEVMAPLQGDAPAGTYGKATATFAQSTNFDASGGTPTAATLTSLRTRLMGLSGKTFVILATDGGPNCDSATTCDLDHCIPNIESSPGCSPGIAPNCCDNNPSSCLDGTAAVASVAALSDAGIPVYVIGVPGSAPYANVLSDMATAGGTQRYYNVTSSGQTSLSAALSQIAAKITATCVFSLGQAPPDANMVNVYLDDQVIPRDPVNGWTIAGPTVTLVGQTCQKVQTGQALQVRIVAGCPTVLN